MTNLESKNGKVIMWRCNGLLYGEYCNYIMSDTEMRAHKFDLGCPRCKQSFANFSLYFEEQLQKIEE